QRSRRRTVEGIAAGVGTAPRVHAVRHAHVRHGEAGVVHAGRAADHAHVGAVVGEVVPHPEAAVVTRDPRTGELAIHRLRLGQRPLHGPVYVRGRPEGAGDAAQLLVRVDAQAEGEPGLADAVEHRMPDADARTGLGRAGLHRIGHGAQAGGALAARPGA